MEKEMPQFIVSYLNHAISKPRLRKLKVQIIRANENYWQPLILCCG